MTLANDNDLIDSRIERLFDIVPSMPKFSKDFYEKECKKITSAQIEDEWIVFLAKSKMGLYG
jgi:hypothetical protein